MYIIFMLQNIYNILNNADNINLEIIPPSLCKSLLEVKKENAIFPIHRNIEIGTDTAAKMTGINVERVEC